MLGIRDTKTFMQSGPSLLKREILFFDKIMLLDAEEAIWLWRNNAAPKADGPAFANDMEFLLDTPYFVAKDPEDQDIDDTLGTNEDREELALRRSQVEMLERAVTEIIRDYDSAGQRPKIERVAPLLAMHSSLITRIEAVYQRMNGVPATSNQPLPALQNSYATGLATGDVIQLAIKEVPVPSDLTPWEQIIELKSDKDLQDRARKLRVWATKTARSETSLASAEEQMRDLLSDYENFTRHHKAKFKSTVLKTAIVGTGELLEDLIKFRVGKLASRFFEAKTMQAEMMLAEASAPGRELSIVTALSEKLQPAR